jgi:hypothetical protein
VRVSANAPDTEHVAITVADNGNGMSPTQQRRLFDPFYTTKLGQGGSGLGMAIVHRLIYETLGGDVSVEAAPGQGSTITLNLPRQAPGDAQTASEIAAAGHVFGSQAARAQRDADAAQGDLGDAPARDATGTPERTEDADAGARAWTS